MYVKEMCTSYIPEKICSMLLSFANTESINEVRLRLNKPLCIKAGGREYFLNESGVCDPEEAYCPSRQDINDTVSLMSDYSLYAFGSELKNGYITLRGGFRAGITGQAVMRDNKIATIKNISSINIRIAREVKGCGEYAAQWIQSQGMGNVLIISPPGCGKTTLLRDIIRILSDGGMTVGVVDERGEIAGAYLGEPQLDTGIRTDVIEDCTKSQGMSILLRSMSPQIIAADEIGTESDKKAIEEIVKCGVSLICTAHGEDIEDLCRKRSFKNMIEERIFDFYIFLKKEYTGKIEKILDKELNKICLLNWQEQA